MFVFKRRVILGYAFALNVFTWINFQTVRIIWLPCLSSSTCKGGEGCVFDPLPSFCQKYQAPVLNNICSMSLLTKLQGLIFKLRNILGSEIDVYQVFKKKSCF